MAEAVVKGRPEAEQILLTAETQVKSFKSVLPAAVVVWAFTAGQLPPVLNLVEAEEAVVSIPESLPRQVAHLCMAPEAGEGAEASTQAIPVSEEIAEVVPEDLHSTAEHTEAPGALETQVMLDCLLRQPRPVLDSEEAVVLRTLPAPVEWVAWEVFLAVVAVVVALGLRSEAKEDTAQMDIVLLSHTSKEQ